MGLRLFVSRARTSERIRSTALGLLVLSGTLAPCTVAAQYPNTYVLPRGALMVSFEPELIQYDTRFGPDGEQEPLGTDLTTDSLGPNFLPTLLAPQLAVRSILDDATYRMTAGAAVTKLDADIRRFPFHIAVGLSSRVTFTAVLPIVTTRMQVDFTLDAAAANVGWNQAALPSGNAAGLSQIQQLLDEIEAAALAVEAEIAQGSFGCPSSAMCDQARDAVLRARTLASNLRSLSGVGGESPLPPFAPLASSAAGMGILAQIEAINLELQSFGSGAFTVTLPLPSEALTAEAINTVLTEPSFGYNASPLAFAKRRNTLGDAEVGLRWGLVQSTGARVVLSTKVRLPTGKVDLPSHFTDLGTGDKQTDLIAGLDAALEPGEGVALGLSGSYTMQLSHQLRRRLTVPERPIALEAAETLVQRNLGDILEISAHPSIRLNRAIRVYLSGTYFRKFRDAVTLAGGDIGDIPGAEPPAALEEESDMQLLTLGGGIYFRSAEDRAGRPRLPVEAGIDYRTAFDGKGGLTPNPTRLHFFLRLYWRLWGERL